MILPSSAFLLRKERRFPIRDAAGDFTRLGVSAAKACLPQVEGVDAAQKARLGAFLTRLQKAVWDLSGAEQAGRLREDWGFPIVIDRPRGFVQQGVGSDGTAWERTYLVDYGFLPDTASPDGEEVDVYCGDDAGAELVVIVSQVKPDGTFDEFKLLCGFDSVDAAIACYTAHCPARFIGAVHTMPTALLRGLLNFEEPDIVQKALAVQDMTIAVGNDTALFGCVHLAKMGKDIRTEKAFAIAKTYTGPAIPIEEIPALADHPARTALLTGIYENPEDVGGWLGWIEPQDWIAFVAVDGRTLLWTVRDGDGGVVGEPVTFQRDDLAQSPLMTAMLSAFDGYMRANKGAISVGTFAGGGVLLPQQGDPRRIDVEKPFAGYEDFDACVAEQLGKGHTEEEARAICGRLQADAHKGTYEDPEECVTGPDGGLVCPEKAREARVAYWETRVANDMQIAKGRLRPGEKRLVYGIVLEPEPNGGAGDAHDETYSAEEVEQACHDFLAYGQNLTSPHKIFVNDQVELVECFIAPEDYTRGGTVVRKGTWVMVVRVIGDALWQEILNGAKTAFSIEGIAKRILNTVLPQPLAA